MSSEYLKAIKIILTNLLSSNSEKKAVIHTNTASKAETIKEEIDSWLNLMSFFNGDIIVINGDIESKVKLMEVTTFASKSNTYQARDIKNLLNLRVLIVISSCVVTGLNSSSVYSIIRIRFLVSVLDMI